MSSSGRSSRTSRIYRPYALAVTFVGAAAAAGVLLSACSHARSVTVAEPLLYAADQRTGRLYAFSLDATAGALKPVDAPADSIAIPSALAVDPSQARLMVATAHNVIAYHREGPALRREPGSYRSGFAPQAIAIDPLGPFLYTAAMDTVAGFRIPADAASPLMEVPGSPFSVGTGVVATGAAIEAGGKNLYVVGGGRLYVFAVDRTTGSLALATRDIVTDAVKIVVHPSGGFLVALTTGTKSALQVFPLDLVTGAVSAPLGPPMDAGAEPSGMTFDASGRYLYVTSRTNNQVRAWAAYVGGTLLPIAGSPFATDKGPSAVVADPSGPWLYVAHTSGAIRGFRIAPETGALEPVGGAAQAGADTYAMAIAPGLRPLTVSADLPFAPAGDLASSAPAPPAAGDEPLTSSDWRVRRQAVSALGHPEPKSGAVEALAAALADPEPRVAETAAYALGRIGSGAHAAIPALAAAARHPERLVRRAAIDALGKLGPDPMTEDVLTTALSGPDPDIRGLAAEGMRRIQTPGEAVAPLVAALVAGPAYTQRQTAASALALMGVEARSGIPALVDALGYHDSEVRRLAADVLAAIGPDAGSAVPELYGAVQDVDGRVRVAATRALLAIRVR